MATDFLSTKDFVRKAYLFALRLYTSSWARKHLISSIRRRLQSTTNFDNDRLTKSAIHPFDEENGTDTSGEMVFHELRSGLKADAYATGYLGCEPSVLRYVLAKIPDRDKASFVDFGCGKGRAAIVASEFEFRAVIGVELSPRLSAIATSNAKVIAQKFPNRCEIDIIQGDATQFDFPQGVSVIYMYHPFERPIMKKVVRSCEKALSKDGREIWIVYQRPIFGSLIDRSPRFDRYLAETIPLQPTEKFFSEESSATVVVWRGSKNYRKTNISDSAAYRRIRVDGLSVTLEPAAIP
jgi:SAM-dependent methyltransferase